MASNSDRKEHDDCLHCSKRFAYKLNEGSPFFCSIECEKLFWKARK